METDVVEPTLALHTRENLIHTIFFRALRGRVINMFCTLSLKLS